MRNVVKLLALILVMSVILRDAKGARPRINSVKVFGPDDIDVGPGGVAGGKNVTDSTGLVN